MWRWVRRGGGQLDSGFGETESGNHPRIVAWGFDDDLISTKKRKKNTDDSEMIFVRFRDESDVVSV
jgi:hypothetical protein